MGSDGIAAGGIDVFFYAMPSLSLERRARMDDAGVRILDVGVPSLFILVCYMVRTGRHETTSFRFKHDRRR